MQDNYSRAMLYFFFFFHNLVTELSLQRILHSLEIRMSYSKATKQTAFGKYTSSFCYSIQCVFVTLVWLQLTHTLWVAKIKLRSLKVFKFCCKNPNLQLMHRGFIGNYTCMYLSLFYSVAVSHLCCIIAKDNPVFS